MAPCVFARAGTISPDRPQQSLANARFSAAAETRAGRRGAVSETAATGAPHRLREHRGIAHPPKTHTGHGMLREAPVSATESRMIHDPSERANGAMTGIPTPHGGAPAPSSEHGTGATD